MNRPKAVAETVAEIKKTCKIPEKDAGLLDTIVTVYTGLNEIEGVINSLVHAETPEEKLRAVKKAMIFKDRYL